MTHGVIVALAVLGVVGQALVAGGARGQLVRKELVEAPARDGRTLALFGPRPDVRGWACTDVGRPSARVLALVNHF